MAYTIEEEQELNQLKEWWKDNGKTIIAAFILGVGGMLGWRYWQSKLNCQPFLILLYL